MADNVTIPATGSGTATPVVATDDVGGVHYQRVKIAIGGDGVGLTIAGDGNYGLPIANGGGAANAASDPIWVQLVNPAGDEIGDSAVPVETAPQDAGGNHIQQSSGTATLANVAASASSVTLQASNGGRAGLIIVNDSTVSCYVKYGSSASTSSYTYKLGPGGILECGPAGIIYTGIVTGIWDSATGNARMTELT